MTKLKAVLAAGGMALAFSFAPATSHAQNAAWCAYAGGAEQYENCGYYTLAQCRASVRGVGGDCRPNPYGRPRSSNGGYYDDEPPPPPRRSRRPY